MEKGDRLGSWVVVVSTDSTPDYIHGTICRCDCGNKRIVMDWEFNTTVEGKEGCEYCNPSEVYEKYPSMHPLYGLWKGMKKRCSSSFSESGYYQYYGGKGVTVCKEWKESLLAFSRDMKYRPKGTSIDRIDNNGNYEPSNCRWATDEEQAQNKSTTKLTPEMVRYIRHNRNVLKRRVKDIAEELGIESGNVSSVANGHTWKNVK